MAGEKTSTKKKKVEKEAPKDSVEMDDDAAAFEEEDLALEQQSLLYEWVSDSRPFRPLNKEIFSTILAGVILLGLILYIIDGVVIVMMLISLMFLWYVLGTVKPDKETHRLTTWGLESGDKLWIWGYFVRFWIEGEEGRRVLVVETVSSWPRHLLFVIDTKESEEAILEIMREYVIEDQPKPNWLDKASRWLETKIRWSVR